MKKTSFIYLLLLIALGLSSCQQEKIFKVLQSNIWQEGAVIKRGFDAIADETIRSNTDFITLNEVYNYYQTRFCDRIVKALRQRGWTYYSFYTEDSGLSSRYPIMDSTTVCPLNDDRGSMCRAITHTGDAEVALYTAHLDYRSCAYYDARGYDGNTWDEEPPVTNLDTPLWLNEQSVRDDVVACFLKEAKKDQGAGRVVILGGDSSKPSRLDWTEATKNMRDHQGLVVPWHVPVMLEKGGFKDTYREIFPNPVTHPGLTCPADCKDIALERLVWSPKADDRDRIDFIHYAPFEGLTLTDVCIIGSKDDILHGQRETEETSDPVMTPLGIWPTNHKAVLAAFYSK